MSSVPDVYARLERIKELWRELEGTRRTSDRYNALVQMIRTESSAYLTLLESQSHGNRARPDRDREDLTAPVVLSGRLERIRELWLELSATPQTSARYTALVEMIRAETAAGDFDGLRDFNVPRAVPHSSAH